MRPLFFLFLLFAACTPFNKEQAKEEILRLHHLQRDYHVEKKAEPFAAMMSDQMISVNRGAINRPTYEENVNRFSSYFNAVSFQKWDDLSEPVIRFSEDGSLAYTIIHKEVVLDTPNEEGDTITERVEYAWLAIYRKTTEGWKIESVASTNKPVEVLE
ncbi:MAG: hypothetical protein AAFR66_23240 [Bacteroidota bacterium]